MKFLKIALMFLILLINLVFATSSWADVSSHFSVNPHYFVGQKVIWHYKARPDSDNIQRIPAEVVKLGSKQVQVKVRKNKNEFVNRWVNQDKLEADNSD
ncbi:hypothetical protein A6770_18515 [Nostoc minutum NIES-26]|uniref:Uncharacterized protein n=1 Tax=Nostoc minutum NIES-26 TaxID=1844469 RepID=A0A367R8T1_9NOSO|nr:hypothetical protein [Dendronalium sp. ChiSLP03b]MDZ8206496.1 hypothetical protein [Dendronalium sp. ChiSLP03b]RCJ32917.1 hypothetical protein A6770_18515 [Nostoc minutum NIES-26]